VDGPDGIVDAFISFQSADEAFAKKLAEGIEAYPRNGQRLKVFFSPWDITPGDNIVEKINQGLERSRFFILILSPQALQADWPTAERAAAIYADPSGRLGRVLTVLRQPCRIPPLLRFRHYLDFRKDSRFDAELTRLLCVLTGEPMPRGCTPLDLYRAVSQKKPDERGSPLTGLAESWKPDPVNEDICCNLFPAKSLPSKVWSAPCFVTDPIPRYFEPEVIIPPHILREKRLYTFVDLSREDNAFSGVVENYDVKSIDTTEWGADEVHSRMLVELLGWGLDKHCRKLGLYFDDTGERYYYDKDVVLKEVKWAPSKRRVSKELVIQYKEYWAHRAVQPEFHVIGNLVFLKINTGWTFTYDGYRPIQNTLRSTLSTKFLAKQKNEPNFREARFWAWFFSEDGKTIKMDFGGTRVEVDANPLSTQVTGGVFGDYTELSIMTSGPPKIFEEAAGREEEDDELE